VKKYDLLVVLCTQVFIGRPALWGLTVDGEQGVKKVLTILRDELDLTMALTGKKNLCYEVYRILII